MPLIRCQSCGEQLDPVARFCGACGTTIDDPNIGRVIGRRFVLRERVGSGSLGIVYRAEQISVGRKVAIKLLPADANRDPNTVERFRREGEVLCKLQSAHTVTTYEYDREPDGSFYIVMELSAGRSLAEVIRTEGPLEWQRTLRILAALCDSLGEAHTLGVIHRDLKPDNILVETRPGIRDFVKVLDFGLAKILTANMSLSPVGQTVGAVEYTSPEQLVGRPLDARSDLYSLGVLGYLMVTGRHPLHEARSFGDLVGAHVYRIPPPASSVRAGIPPDVDVILARCLDKDPDRRYPDAPTLASMIGILLAGLPSDPGHTLRDPERPIGEDDTALGPVPTKPR